MWGQGKAALTPPPPVEGLRFTDLAVTAWEDLIHEPGEILAASIRSQSLNPPSLPRVRQAGESLAAVEEAVRENGMENNVHAETGKTVRCGSGSSARVPEYLSA
jgi:hypothetical protein